MTKTITIQKGGESMEVPVDSLSDFTRKGYKPVLSPEQRLAKQQARFDNRGWYDPRTDEWRYD